MNRLTTLITIAILGVLIYGANHTSRFSHHGDNSGGVPALRVETSAATVGRDRLGGPNPVQDLWALRDLREPQPVTTRLPTAAPDNSRDDIRGGIWPVAGSITTYYSQWHLGLDIGVSCGTTVVAINTGTVTLAGWLGGYGNLVVLAGDDGIISYYGHLEQIWVGYGERVAAGQGLGTVGTTGNSTGCHLHLETFKDGWYVNPLDVLGGR